MNMVRSYLLGLYGTLAMGSVMASGSDIANLSSREIEQLIELTRLEIHTLSHQADARRAYVWCAVTAALAGTGIWAVYQAIMYKMRAEDRERVFVEQADGYLRHEPYLIEQAVDEEGKTQVERFKNFYREPEDGWGQLYTEDISEDQFAYLQELRQVALADHTQANLYGLYAVFTVPMLYCWAQQAWQALAKSDLTVQRIAKCEQLLQLLQQELALRAQ